MCKYSPKAESYYIISDLTSLEPCRHLRVIVLQDDEYVVYSPDQVKLKYVVQFSTEGDELKEFSPAVVTSAEPCLPSAVQGDYFKVWFFGLAVSITSDI